MLPAPENLAPRFLDDGSVLLAWDIAGTSQTHFAVQYSPDGGATWLAAGDVGGSQPYFVATDLPGTLADAADYQYRVRAEMRDDGGAVYHMSAWSLPVEPALAAPSGHAAVPADPGELELDWIFDNGDQNRQRVEYSVDGGATWVAPAGGILDGYDDSFVLSGVPDGSSYSFRVRSEFFVENDQGTGTLVETSPWSATSAAAYLPLLAPSGVNAVAVSDTEIRVDWTDNSAGEGGYQIERRPAAGEGESWQFSGSVGVNVTSFLDSTIVNPSAQYLYRVLPLDGIVPAAAAASEDPHTVSGSEALVTESEGVIDGIAAGKPLLITYSAKEINWPHGHIYFGASGAVDTSNLAAGYATPERPSTLNDGDYYRVDISVNGELYARNQYKLRWVHPPSDIADVTYWVPQFEFDPDNSINPTGSHDPAGPGYTYSTQASTLSISVAVSGPVVREHYFSNGNLYWEPVQHARIGPVRTPEAKVDLVDPALSPAQEQAYGSLVKLNSDNDNGSKQEFGWPEKRDFEVAADPEQGYVDEEGNPRPTQENDLKLLGLTISGINSGTDVANVKLTYDNSKIKVYADSQKKKLLPSGGSFYAGEGTTKPIYVEGIKLSTKLKDLTLEAQATISNGIAVRGAKDELKLAVGPILKNLRVKSLVGAVTAGVRPDGSISARGDGGTAAKLIATFASPNEQLTQNVQFIQTMRVRNYDGVTVNSQKWFHGFGLVDPDGSGPMEKIDNFGQELVDSLNRQDEPYYLNEVGTERNERIAYDTPALGAISIVPPAGTQLHVHVRYEFDLFAYSKLAERITRSAW